MKTTRNIFIFATAAMLALSPTLTFAKDHGKGGDNDNGHGNAWGHLIAPGWIAHNGAPTSIPANLPPGIAKHLDGSHCDSDDTDDNRTCPTPTPSVTPTPTVSPTPTPTPTTSPTPTPTPTNSPLVVSNVSSTVLGQTEAIVTWNTNNSANSTVWYSTSSPVSTSTAHVVSSGTNVFNHFLVLSGLSASTTYHFMIGSTDTFGNTATSAESTFTTAAGTFVNPLTITNAVAMVGTTSATLTWTTNLAADTEVYFGTTSPVVIGSSATSEVSNSALVTTHSITVNSLAPSTTYYMILQSKDASSNVQSTSQFSFTTGL